MSIRFVPVSPLPAPLRMRDFLRLSRALEREIPKTKEGAIGVRFVSANEIRRLNREYRGKDLATDVLSFQINSLSSRAKSYEAEGSRSLGPDSSARRGLLGRNDKGEHIVSLGDLAVCPFFAKREAHRRGIAWREELLRLLAHGALHLAGMDHETEEEEARMFAKQERAVAKTIKKE